MSKTLIIAVSVVTVLLFLGACAGTGAGVGGGGGAPSPATYALLVHIIPGEGGTIQMSPLPDPDGTYPEGTRVFLEARPGKGYRFARWSGDAQGTTSSIVVTVNQDQSVIAEFAATVGPSYITVLSLQDKSEVSWYQKLEGKSAEVIPGSKLNLYVLLYPVESNGPWWVQPPVELHPDGSWEAYAYFGRDPMKYPEDVGDEFYVITIATRLKLEPGQQWYLLPDLEYKSDLIQVRRK